MKAKNGFSEEFMRYLVERLLRNSREAAARAKEDRTNDFEAGRSEAYYEVLDMIKGQLLANGEEPEKYGLDIDLEKECI